MASINPYNAPEQGGDYGRRYPNQFFDLASNHIPTDIKTLFRYCRTFFYTDSFLNNVVRKLTEYPITDLLYETDIDEKLRENWNKIIHERLKIKSFLVEMGLDYFTYGNSFVSVVITKSRHFKNPSDGRVVPFSTTQYKFKNWKFHPIIDGKESPEPWEIEDIAVKSVQNFKLIRWNPENIDIEYNPITGTSQYYYQIPNEIRRKITTGDRAILQDIPLIFIDAVKHNRSLQLDSNFLFHFKLPGLAEQEMAWGKPLILPALKKIYYLQTLQRGNEAIAHDHIVPKKVISPAATGAVDPFTSMNMSKWSGQVQSEIKRWRRDPNHIAIMPIPMQYQEMGGNARALLLTQEMAFLEEIIINSLGVPKEFIKGGASWTGSSISLRIVENMFLGYRANLLDFLNQFLLPKISRHLGIGATTLRFKKFRMSDDAQSKQLNIQLSQMDKLSDSRLLDEFGFNPDEEFKLINLDRARKLEYEKEAARLQAVAQGEGQVILAKYAAQSQMAGEAELLRLRVERVKDELNQESGGDIPDIIQYIESLALQLLYSPEPLQASEMLKISKKQPVLFSLVMERMQELSQGGATLDPQQPRNQKPNQQNPGERSKDQVAIPEKAKQKGNTRGTPRD